MTDPRQHETVVREAGGGASGRPRGVQRVFEVIAAERLSPQFVRVHLGGAAFDDFVRDAGAEKLALTDMYVKFLFAKPSLGLEPPYDLEALRGRLDPADMPVRRTYTVRAVDLDRRTIAVDFVVHGDDGLAGPWAAAARPGDRVALSGPGGRYSPAGGDAFHLFVADESALPATAAALAVLPATARGLALLEVADADARLPLSAPESVRVVWLHRDGAPYGARLVEAVEGLDKPEGPIDVFAHGEREAVKRIGAILAGDWGIERQAMSLSAYWAFGRTEDTFQSEKRTPIGQIL